MLARTVTSLSALSGGRVVLGMGTGGLWDRISEREHGASGFTLFSAGHGAPDVTVLARWAQEIVPSVREALAKETAKP